MHQPAIGVGTCTFISLLCSEQRLVRALQAERRPRAAEVWALQDTVLTLTQELELEQAACLVGGPSIAGDPPDIGCPAQGSTGCFNR